MKIKNILATATLVLASSTASAAMITQFGDNVSYTYDDSTAFGTGFVLGDALFFTPASFLAESVDGAGIDTITATLNIDVLAATSGYRLTSFSLSEEGDYRQRGSGASVAVDAFFSATSLTTLCGPYRPCRDTVFFDAGTFADTNASLAPWGVAGSLDLSWGSDTNVRLTVQNTLTAETLASREIAFIQKKFVIIVPEVPVPAAVWLFGSGLIGLIAVARRKA